MKHFYSSLTVILSLITLVITATGCGKSSKEISPTATEFSSGDLSKFIEVEDEPVTVEIKKNDEGQKVVKMKVTLKLAREAAEFRNAEPTDIQVSDMKHALMIQLLSKDDEVLKNLSLDEDDVAEIKNLLRSSADATAQVTFTRELDDDEDTDWFSDVESFQPSGTASVRNNSKLEGNYLLKGSISRYGVTMEFTVSGSDVNGSYYYDRYGGQGIMKLQGSYDPKQKTISLNEFSETDLYTGSFNGTVQGDKFVGKWEGPDGSSYSFSLSITPNKN